MAKRVLRLREVEEVTGYRHTAIYRKISLGEFPKPIRLGPNAVGWLETEIDQWIDERVAARDAEAA